MPSPDGGRLALLQHTEGSNVWLLRTSEHFPECWNVSKRDSIQSRYSSLLANMNSSARTAELCSGRITGKQEVIDYFLFADIAQRDFAEWFERGKLSFTGDVLQVISVF